MVGAMLLMWVVVWQTPPASLGEAAIREAVRRARVGPAVHRVTTESLGPLPVATMTPVAASPIAVSEEPAAEVKDEAWWRQRMAAARDALARDRALVPVLEGRIAGLTSAIAGRDDPAQRAQLVAEREQALQELSGVQGQIDAGVRAIAAIEEEARKAGVPPGWLR